jgi:hypothetical protein
VASLCLLVFSCTADHDLHCLLQSPRTIHYLKTLKDMTHRTGPHDFFHFDGQQSVAMTRLTLLNASQMSWLLSLTPVSYVHALSSTGDEGSSVGQLAWRRLYILLLVPGGGLPRSKASHL